MISSEPSSRPSTSAPAFHDLDEFLLGPTDLEAMPFEFGCDFASAFVEVESPGATHGSGPLRDAKRGIKRKGDAMVSTPFVVSSTTTATSSSSPSSSSSSASASVTLNPLESAPGHESAATGSTQIGRWTKKEHELFLEGLRLYGKSWKKISSLVVTRTLVQIRTHAQKYLQKQNKSAMKAAAAAAAASAPKNRAMHEDDAQAAHQWTHASSSSSSSEHHHPSHATLFHPIAFPDHGVSASSSSSSSSSSPGPLSSSSSSAVLSSSYLLRKEPSAMSRLDQLLHDDYYASPTGTDDDLAQWLQHRHLPLLATNANSPAATKRRRIDTTSSPWPIVNPMEAMASSSLPSFFSHSCHSGHSQPIHSASEALFSDHGLTFGSSWL